MLLPWGLGQYIGPKKKEMTAVAERGTGKKKPTEEETNAPHDFCA